MISSNRFFIRFNVVNLYIYGNMAIYRRAMQYFLFLCIHRDSVAIAIRHVEFMSPQDWALQSGQQVKRVILILQFMKIFGNRTNVANISSFQFSREQAMLAWNTSVRTHSINVSTNFHSNHIRG